MRAPEHIRTSVAERYLPLLRRAAAKRFDERATVEVVGADWREPAAERRLRGDSGAPARPRPASHLNPKYTFEQFVIGQENRFAHAAALAVAELPGHSYNPLFLHGSPGFGKTHLLHAIGNYVERFGSGLSVRYATIEEFTSEFVERGARAPDRPLQEGFRRADVLLVDDVQFLAGRAKTREEFFHTFNSLLESGRQLVMTSDRSPEEIPGLEERLIERFRAGLVVELERRASPCARPSSRKRARLDGVEVPTTGDRPRSAPGDHQRAGARGRADPRGRLRLAQGRAAHARLARHVLRRLGADTGTETCGIPEILDAAAASSGSNGRRCWHATGGPAVATARQVAMYLARELTGHSLPEIGRGIGGRSHTTVLHAVNRVSAAMSTDPDVQSAVDNLRRQLGRPA